MTSDSKQTIVTTDVAIIGGGVAGLAAAAYLARAGRKVILLEKAPALGGRAITHHYGDFLFNQGPHALYRGIGESILQELGIEFSGGLVNTNGVVVQQGQCYPLPASFKTILASPLFSVSSKAKMLTFLTRLALHRLTVPANLSLQDWLLQEFPQPAARSFMEATARLSTYANVPASLSLALFVSQMQIALKKVRYVDNGWQTMVAGLEQAARQAGAELRTAVAVRQVRADGAIELAGGQTIQAEKVIVAVNSPAIANALIENGTNPALQRYSATAKPIRAACLDLALRCLPEPTRSFALGLDQPLYMSVHSAYAKLGPSGKVVLHAAKYLPIDSETDAKADERELEEFMDVVQPGWQNEVLERRYLPKMLVTHLVPATANGLSGRIGPQIEGLANILVAGDWVGPEGWLVDAALASGKHAANLILDAKPASLRQPELELV